jgi:hypothetical protein
MATSSGPTGFLHLGAFVHVWRRPVSGEHHGGGLPPPPPLQIVFLVPCPCDCRVSLVVRSARHRLPRFGLGIQHRAALVCPLLPSVRSAHTHLPLLGGPLRSVPAPSIPYRDKDVYNIGYLGRDVRRNPSPFSVPQGDLAQLEVSELMRGWGRSAVGAGGDQGATRVPPPCADLAVRTTFVWLPCSPGLCATCSCSPWRLCHLQLFRSHKGRTLFPMLSPLVLVLLSLFFALCLNVVMLAFAAHAVAAVAG